MKTYKIENDYIGWLNHNEEYSSYIDAMIALMEFIKEDNKLIDDSISLDYPKAKWNICEITEESESKIIYSVTTKKVNKQNKRKRKNDIMKAIKLKDINPKTFWIETKIKGDYKYRETERKSFTGKRFKMFGDTCITFTCFQGNKKCMPIVNADFVKARVQIWNSETKENEYFKIIF